jgi:tricorn protease
MFRAAGIGPLVGLRTWGGGIGGYLPMPELSDGGAMLVPNRAFYNPRAGTWDIENHGVAPDVAVELSPARWREGHDTQLEAAVHLALKLLKRHPLRQPRRPAYPRYP